MAFIDGMHHFEYALRDFINIEPLCRTGSVVFIHDCYPIDARSAERDQVTAFWSGDIWRLLVLLKKYRPDLAIHTLGTPPTGLGLITRLDPEFHRAAQPAAGTDCGGPGAGLFVHRAAAARGAESGALRLATCAPAAGLTLEHPVSVGS